MTLALFAVLGLLGWAVWTTLQDTPTLSLLPTPLPGPTLTASPTLTPSPGPFFETAQAGVIAQEAAAARSLMPRWETPLTLLDTHDLSVILYHRYEAQPPFPLSDKETLQALGLWPDEDLQPDPVAQAKIAPALYFPEEGQLYLRRDWSGPHDTMQMLIAYGYALTLPDQYGDLQRLREDSSSLDQRLALEALSAGDALVTLARYRNVLPGSSEAAALLDKVAEATLPQWRGDAPILQRLSRLPLDLGRSFAVARYKTGGLPALDEAIRRPPPTTEQLLHPERYSSGEPLSALDAVSVSLGSRWTLTHTENVGEALMTFTLAEWSQGTLTTTAEGWAGDLLQVWEGPEGKEIILWQTVWDSNSQAEAFATQMEALMPGRIRELRPNPTVPAKLSPGKWWTSRWGAALLQRRGSRVWLLWGTDTKTVQTLGGALP